MWWKTTTCVVEILRKDVAEFEGIHPDYPLSIGKWGVLSTRLHRPGGSNEVMPEVDNFRVTKIGELDSQLPLQFAGGSLWRYLWTHIGKVWKKKSDEGKEIIHHVWQKLIYLLRKLSDKTSDTSLPDPNWLACIIFYGLYGELTLKTWRPFMTGWSCFSSKSMHTLELGGCSGITVAIHRA